MSAPLPSRHPLSAEQVHRLVEKIRAQPVDTALPSHIATARVNRTLMSFPHLTLVLEALCQAAQSERALIDQVGGFVSECFSTGTRRWHGAMEQVHARQKQLRAEDEQRRARQPKAEQLSLLS